MTNKKSRTFLQSASLLRAFLIYFSALLVLISMGAFLLNIHAWPLFTAVFGAWTLILRSFFGHSK